MKSVLIVSYHYPPDLAVGAIRPAKFAQYLPDYDCKPVILTVKDKYYEKLDELKGDNGLGGEQVFRTAKIPNFRDFYMVIKTTIAKRTTGEQKNILPKVRSSDGDILQEFPESTTKKLKRYFNSLFVWLPDDKTGWIIPAVFKGIQLIRSKQIEAIYTTGPPHSCHIVGLLLKLLTNRTWVADFRDPWIGGQKPSFVKSEASEVIENWLEKKVVAKSDHVVSVTPEMTRMFQKRYPEINPEKFVTIYNGYDSEEIEHYKKLNKYDKITFTYAGSFYLGRDPELFLRALRVLIEDGKIPAESVQVRFIGNCRYLYEKSIEEMVGEIGLEKIVNFIDHVPRHEAMTEMAKSHVLLLLAPDQPLQIPGKIYEYMGFEAFILAVCGAGATANILKHYSKAVLVSTKDIETMEDAILKVVKQVKINSKLIEGTESDFFIQLERNKLTSKLATFFNQNLN